MVQWFLKPKILTPKQMLQRSPIALAQAKAGNNSKSLLNETHKLFILCINQKKLLKKYIITKTSKPHVLILNLTDKLDLRRGKKKYCFIKS